MLRVTLALLAAALAVASPIHAAPPAAKKPVAPPSPKPRLAPPSQAGQPLQPSDLPSDTDIQRMVDDRVVTYHDAVGLIVGVIEPAGRRLFVRGPAQVGNDDQVDGDTIFEIGSVSKVFTALALTDAAHRGELSLTDPVAKYLPAGAVMPQHGGKPVTLLDLETDEKIEINPADLRETFTEQVTAFLDGVRKACSDSGAEYHKLFVDIPYDRALISLMNRR